MFSGATTPVSFLYKSPHIIASTHSTLTSLHRFNSTTYDRCLTAVAASLVGSDEQCQFSRSLLYSEQDGLRVFSSAASCSLTLTYSACHLVRSFQLLPTNAFLMTPTYLAKRFMICRLLFHLMPVPVALLNRSCVPAISFFT